MDMGALDEASAVLRAAEQNLRIILVKAAEGGDYDHLLQIAEWAKLDPAGYRLEWIDNVVPDRLMSAYLDSSNGMNDAINVTVSGASGLTKAYTSVWSACGSALMSGASRWLDARPGII